MLQEQLGKAQDAYVVLSSLQTAGDGGLLGNKLGQAPIGSVITDNTPDVYLGQFGGALSPGFKLALLKLQKFTAKGREQRIAASLAAIGAPQPTELSAAEWKIALEEADEDQG